MSDSAMSEKAPMMERIFGAQSGARFALGLGVWFGAWRSGELGRIGYLIAVVLLYGLLGVAQWLMLDAMQPDPIAEMLPDHQPMSQSTQTVIFAAFTALSVLTLLLGCNVLAKRVRHIGWPGWWTVLGLTIVNIGGFFAAPTIFYPWFGLLVLIVPALIPGGLAGQRQSASE